MHENWEFLLSKSRGEWIIFIGDDDGVMQHCVDHLRYLTDRYPQAEAIVSPRAYYFWNGCQTEYGSAAVAFEFGAGEVWQDTKEQMKRCLRGEINYLRLPQMYSGGFHRRSMVNRVLLAQDGTYFKSVTPDAYSAAMACVHTFRYLETRLPMTWVGTSPHRGSIKGAEHGKDRVADFYGMHYEHARTINQSLGDLKKYTFSLVFFEALISAYPVNPYTELSVQCIRKMYLEAVDHFRRVGDDDAVAKLASDLGFEIPPVAEACENREGLAVEFYRRIRNGLARRLRVLAARKTGLSTKESVAKTSTTIYRYESQSHDDHPNILSCDSMIRDAYMKWKAQSKDSDLAPPFPI
jgi:hypothetical protein